MNTPAIWWQFDATLDRRQYVQRVLGLYRSTPTCAGKIRREDGRLAYRLYDRRTPLHLVEAAFILAAMRRLYRRDQDELISPIRSLHYFLPLLDEIRQQAIDPDYIAYALQKVRDAPQPSQTDRQPSA